MRVMGYMVAAGKADKGQGNEYKIPKVFLSVLVEQMTTKHMTVVGKGREGAEMPLDEGALPQFEKLNFPIEGLELDLVIDQKKIFGELKSVCMGIRGQMPKAA